MILHDVKITRRLKFINFKHLERAIIDTQNKYYFDILRRYVESKSNTNLTFKRKTSVKISLSCSFEAFSFRFVKSLYSFCRENCRRGGHIRGENDSEKRRARER